MEKRHIDDLQIGQMEQFLNYSIMWSDAARERFGDELANLGTKNIILATAMNSEVPLKTLLAKTYQFIENEGEVLRTQGKVFETSSDYLVEPLLRMINILRANR